AGQPGGGSGSGRRVSRGAGGGRVVGWDGPAAGAAGAAGAGVGEGGVADGADPATGGRAGGGAAPRPGPGGRVGPAAVAGAGDRADRDCGPGPAVAGGVVAVPRDGSGARGGSVHGLATRGDTSSQCWDRVARGCCRVRGANRPLDGVTRQGFAGAVWRIPDEV